MLGQYAGTSAAATPQYLRLEDFEREGVRVAERRYTAKDTLFAPGNPDGQLYFLLDGTVRLYRIYGGYKEATVALLKNGGVFGELGLDEGSRQSVFAEALTGVRVAVVRKSTLTDVIKRRPEFALNLFFSFSERLRQSDEVIESLLDREVSARLATLLSNLGDRFGEPNGSGTILKVRLIRNPPKAFHTRGAASEGLTPSPSPTTPHSAEGNIRIRYHPSGSGEHDRLHQGGRLQGDERVPARRPHRGTEPHDISYPAAR